MSREWILLRGLGREKKHSQIFIDQLQKRDPEAVIQPIDLPGAGEYHRLSSPATMTGIAEFVHAHLLPARPSQRFVVAISLGGMVAVELARLHPKAVDGVVVINSSFKNLSPLFDRLQPEALWQLFRAVTAGNNQDREREVLKLVSNNSQREQWVEPWSQIAKDRPVSPFNFLKQLIAAATYDLPYTKPDVPFYVLTSEGDRMVKSNCSKKLAETWQLPLAIHPSGGHELYIDEPDWVIDQLFKFCGR